MIPLLTVVAAMLESSGRRLRSRFGSSEGQTLVEYSLILFLVALGIVVALSALSGQLNTFFHTVINDL